MLPFVSRTVFHKLRYAILAALPCVLSLASNCAAASLPGYVVVPITLKSESNQAIMRATVNGKATSLILDTGATTTVLDSSFYKGARTQGGAAESKLPPELQNKQASANGEKVDIGYIDSLKAGSMDFGGGPVMVADFSHQFGQYNNSHPASTVSGLIGEDILHRYSAIIDWARRGVYFNTNPAKRLKLGPGLTSAGWTAIPLSITNAHHFAVACTVEDQPVRLLVDTGAQFTAFDQAAIKLHNMMYNRDTGNSMSHIGVNAMHATMFGMDSNAYLAKLENWKIGNYPVKRSVVATSAMPPGITTRETGGDGPIVGLLGAEILAANNAIIDVAASRLYLKPSGSR